VPGNVPITRRELFLERDIKRLCLTTDAGIGKSCAIRWAQAAPGADPCYSTSTLY